MRNKKKRLRNLFKSFSVTHGFWPRTWIVTKIIALLLWRICLIYIAICLSVYAIIWGIVAVILFVIVQTIYDDYNDRQRRTVYIKNRYWW